MQYQFQFQFHFQFQFQCRGSNAEVYKWPNLNGKSVVDNKLFWKTVKPLLSDKFAGKGKYNLIENNELVKTNLETAEVLNNFFFPYGTKH